MNYTELELPKAGDTVVVGLSGGVDSTMTALLLKERGCHVIGATMSLWPEGKYDLPSGPSIKDACFSSKEISDIEDCRRFCQEYGIEYHVIDVKDEYESQVLEYFRSEYRNGRTPNPCIRCNRYIKFGAFLEGIDRAGIKYDYFCTGHYAKIVRGDQDIRTLFGENACDTESGHERPAQVAVAMDATKDQAYFLNRIPSRVLEKVRFPLANIPKKEVFEMARARGLAAAEKEESQDFVPPEHFEVLFSDRPSVPGDFIDFDGKVLGRHRGIEHYTIGQRRGLGISAPYPLYVAAIDRERNLVVLGQYDDLLCAGLIADELVWPADYNPQCSFEAFVKIRLAARPVKARISPYSPQEGQSFNGKAVKIVFEEKQRAVAPGQAVVFYIDGVDAGSGTIAMSF